MSSAKSASSRSDVNVHSLLVRLVLLNRFITRRKRSGEHKHHKVSVWWIWFCVEVNSVWGFPKYFMVCTIECPCKSNTLRYSDACYTIVCLIIILKVAVRTGRYNTLVIFKFLIQLLSFDQWLNLMLVNHWLISLTTG